MLEIFGGRKEFFQWDINQYLMVDSPDIKEVHFSNVYEKQALVVEVVEGKAAVPNILLQYASYIYAYAFCGECVRYDAAYKVNQRAKPADYIYTETELKNYDDLEKRIAALEEGSGSGEEESAKVETLIPPHIQNHYDAEKIKQVSQDLINGVVYPLLIQVYINPTLSDYFNTSSIKVAYQTVRYNFTYNGKNYWFSCSYDGEIDYGIDEAVVLTSENFAQYISNGDEVSY